MYVRLLTNNFLSEKAVGKSESEDVHLAVLGVLPEVIRESVDAEQHADYRKGEGGKGTEGERRHPGRIVAVNQGKRGGSGGGTEDGRCLESHRRREGTQRGSRQGGSGAHSDREGGSGKESR